MFARYQQCRCTSTDVNHVESSLNFVRNFPIHRLQSARIAVALLPSLFQRQLLLSREAVGIRKATVQIPNRARLRLALLRTVAAALDVLRLRPDKENKEKTGWLR